MRKGQINLEFLFAAIIYLGAVGTVFIAGTNILPDLSGDVQQSDLYTEAYTVSTKILSKPGHSTYGDSSNWEKNDSTVESTTSLGLSSSTENYMVVEPDKLEKLEGFSSTPDKINYSEFKAITGVENQYRLNFTWMPVSYLSGDFKRFESSSIPVSTSDDLIANWKLDEENSDSSDDPDSIVKDSSGADNDGTAYGNFGFDQSGIRGTSAYYFDDEEYFEVNEGYDPKESTISLWIRPDTLAGSQKIMRLGGNGKNWSLELNSGELNVEYEDSGGATEIYSSELTRDWAHVAATIAEDGEYRLYVDGDLKGSGVSRENLTEVNPSKIIVGAGDKDRTESPEEGFGGKIDDVRIYNRSLNAEEIVEIYRGEDDYTKADVSKIIEPDDSGYTSSGNTVRFGRDRIGDTYPHFLAVSHNEVYDRIYFSNTWNFSGRTPISEGDEFFIQGETFRVKAIQNQGRVRGNALVLEQNLKSFGPEASPQRSVITLERFAVYKNEPMKMEVLSW